MTLLQQHNVMESKQSVLEAYNLTLHFSAFFKDGAVYHERTRSASAALACLRSTQGKLHFPFKDLQMLALDPPYVSNICLHHSQLH
ncbi:hypothetical protein PHYPO_G00182720 [Pangasianodon hypophthalmus]|uniref:Uncharacterized protein n=1 Tax=Pangasianodon hypophthalmus TaxID=310915 RepID=A0A5N5PSN7_PANHP|nr:hypothetical protein PHYPO_G00182720 [Pangasianodon hypophthalmus]